MTTIEQQVDGGRGVALARVGALNGALALLGVILLFAFGSRFWELGRMALHHDESLHALYSFYEYDRWGYTHDPLMHGPLLFHMVAFGYWLAGVSDASARLVPALLGVLLVWTPWKFREWLGTKGALAASALILISPSLLYYSRFIRHDIFLAVWTVIIVYGMWKYLQRGEPFHLYLMSAGWALAYSEKEVSYLLTAVFWSFLAVAVAGRWLAARQGIGPHAPLRAWREWHLLLLIGALALPHTAAMVMHLAGLDPVGGYSAGVYRNPQFLMQAGAVVLLLFGIGAMVASMLWDGRRFLVAAAVFYAIFILLHTNFLTWPWGIASGMVGSLGYWIDQQAVERGGQPWYYYSLLVPLYEFLPLLLGLGGMAWHLGTARNGEVIPRDKAAEAHLDTRALWPFFNLWWFGALFFALSYAGEKMPWLLVHLALPLAFLGGWGLDRLLEHAAWARLRSGAALRFAGLVALAFLSGVTIVWLALRGEWLFGGTDIESLRRSSRWLAALLLLAGASWGMVRLRERLDRGSMARLALLVVSGLLALATVRFAWIGAFRNADVANEPLIYTQSSPDVPMVVREIETISRRMTGGKEIQIAYDSGTTWPFEWYLRDYPNRFLFGSSPDSYVDRIREAPIVLASQDTNRQVESIVGDSIKHHYAMRPNFPEDYKKLMDVVELQPDPTNPDQMNRVVTGQSRGLLTVLGNVFYQVGQPQARADFLDFFWNRRITRPLGVYDFYVYVKPEVAAEVWQYGLTVATMDPELTKDPYFEAMVPLQPTTTFDRPDEFKQPKDVALLPDGNLVVADAGNHRILLLSPSGERVSEFGSFGAEPGQFNEPWGVAAAPDGTIYVADTWNHRIQHLDEEGNVLHSWGGNIDTAGELGASGLFYGPRDVAVDEQGRVFVTDTGNKRVQVFDAEGNFLEQFGGGGIEAGRFEEPVGIAVAPDGTIWVADTWNKRVQGFSPTFEPLRQIAVRAWDGQGITNKPYLAVSDENIWLSDPDAARLIELDREGTVQRVWGQFGSELGSFNLPLGLAFADGTLWVADSENQRVLGFAVER